MKRNLQLLGFLLLVLGGGILIWMFKTHANTTVADTITFNASEGLPGHKVELATNRLVQVKLQLEVESTSVQEEFDSEFVLRYDIPVKLVALGPDGKQIHSETLKVHWETQEADELAGAAITRDGGMGRVDVDLSSFAVPGSPLTIAISFGPDSTYGAVPGNVKAEVVDNVYDYTAPAFSMLSLWAAGYLCLLIGAAIGAEVSEKQRLLAAALCIGLGYFGVHRFYLGRPITGVLQIFTCGGVGLWVLLDTFVILAGLMCDGKGRRVKVWVHPAPHHDSQDIN